MKKVAIINANSFASYFPQYIRKLEIEVGTVDRFKFDAEISTPELSEALQGYSYAIVGTVPQFTREFFDMNNSIRYIARFGVGYNNIDVAAARKHGVIVSNMPSYLEKEDVAEQAVSLTMALLKHVVDGNKAVHDNEWNTDRRRFLGKRLNKKIVGVIGLGFIGSTFARIMKHGFECDVRAFDPYLSEKDFEIRHAKQATLEKIIRESDIISLHMNLTEENYHLINESRLLQLKKGAIIVNTARGELVDEAAVAAALNEGILSGYGADVIENEPPKTNHPLLSAKNTVITPHLGTYNTECNEEMCACIVEDIIRVNQNGLPTNVLEE